MKTDLEHLLSFLEDQAIDAEKKRLEFDSDLVYSDFNRGLFHGQELAYEVAIKRIKDILKTSF